MPLPKTNATLYYAQLGISDKGLTIKGLIVCYVVLLGYMKGIWVLGHAQGAQVWSLVVARMAFYLKYRNTPI